jgi:hypothetical protein
MPGSVRPAIGVGGVSLLLGVGMLVLPAESRPRLIAANLALLLAPLAAALGARSARRAAPTGRARLAWQLLLVGAAAGVLGQVEWTVREVLLGRAVPFPSLSFAFFVAFHLLFSIAAVLALRPARDRQHALEIALDGTLFLLAAAALWLRFVLEEPVVNGWLSLPQASAMLIGEVANTASFFFALLLLVWRDTVLPEAAVYGLAAVAATFLAGDILLVIGLDPDPARSGDPFELIWLLGWLGLCVTGVIAAVRPMASDRAKWRPRTARRIRLAILPASAVFLAVASIDAVRRPYFTTASGLVLLTIGAVLGIRVVSALLATERNAERRRRAEGEAHRARTRALIGRLHPHFLLNVLNGIAQLIRSRSSEAEKAVQRLGRLLRYTLDIGDEDDLVTLRSELRLTREYLSLERLRLGDRLRVRTAIDPEVLDDLVPPFVLQPLVENAVRHGVSQRAGGGTVTVRARASDGRLLMEVRDDGSGADADRLQDGTGLGLRGVRAQLRSYYGPAARLRIRTAPGQGFAVRLRIPRSED